LPAPGKLTFKLVYYGPAQSGKSTNLVRLHDELAPAMKGELMIMETQGDRTLYFDLLPLGFRAPSGLLVKFRVFTVPGQVQHDGTRKAVLSRTDGIVFVADSQRNQTINNGESFQNLADNVARVGLDFSKMPLAVQFNKRDLADVLSEDEIRARWGQAPWPISFAAATTGEGVARSFADLLHQIYRRYGEEFALATTHGLTEADFVKGAMGPLRAAA
jgi:signal recognition particle receptor subunit beta